MFLFEFIERQWLQTDFSCLADNNNSVSFIGEKDGASCFSAYIKNEKTGFPVALVLYSNGKIAKVGGFLALDVIASFEKN